MAALTVCCKMCLQGLAPARQHLMQLDHADWHAVMCAVGPALCRHASICILACGWHWFPASVRQSRYTQQHPVTLTAADAATRHQLALMDNKEMTS